MFFFGAEINGNLIQFANSHMYTTEVDKLSVFLIGD